MNGSHTLRTVGARSLLAAIVLVALTACGSSLTGSNGEHDATTATASTDGTASTDTASTGTEVATSTEATDGTGTTAAAQQAGTATDAQLQQEIDDAVSDAEAAIAEAEQMVGTLDKELQAAAAAAANGG